MFGAKKVLGKILDMNYSAESVVEKNMMSVKEYCHVTYEEGGWVQHVILDANSITYNVTDEYTERMISVNSSALSGAIKGAQIFFPRTELS